MKNSTTINKSHGRIQITTVVPPEDLDHTTDDGIPNYYRIPKGSRDILDILVGSGIEHCRCCAIEYIYRAGRKTCTVTGELEDLRKARNHLDREIESLEKRIK